jgi:CRISPR-associated protein Cmr2
VSGESTALLTFSIGPVHSFIGQARRIADLWAGSAILSDVTTAAMTVLRETAGAKLIFPAAEDDGSLPHGLPNRFVARVPASQARAIAEAMQRRVRERWTEIVDQAVKLLERVQIDARQEREKENASWHDALTTAWSCVPENGNYVAASNEGARVFAASRVYRPFTQTTETGTKCAICGERNALPNGRREDVRNVWSKAEKLAPKQGLAQYFRVDQGRLCLVCAAKRLYPASAGPVAVAKFSSFDKFQPDEDRPYFAVVTMDGDNLGDRLAGHGQMNGRELEAYQQQVSLVLSRFADTLRTADSALLNLTEVRDGNGGKIKSIAPSHPPQLIYAGGEDVLFVADPRDALPAASAIQRLYARMFDESGLSSKDFTISAAVLFAHTSVPAGVLFNDADRLLNETAKEKAHRNSVAVAMHKRSGRPVEIAFRWDEKWIERLQQICDALRSGRLASRQTYDLAEANEILKDVFGENDEQWAGWLRFRLGQGELSKSHVDALLELLEPFFLQRKTEAFRIARFIAVDAEPREGSAAERTA